jgi:hypothetical protein
MRMILNWSGKNPEAFFARVSFAPLQKPSERAWGVSTRTGVFPFGAVSGCENPVTLGVRTDAGVAEGTT